MPARIVAFCAAAALVIGCGPSAAPPPTPDPLAGTYVGFGSATALDNTKLVTAAFSKLHPGVVFQLNVTDTETSIVKVRSNDTDTQFGFIGRELLPTDGAIATTLMGATGSAFAVNAANPVRSLTKAQLRAILTGATTDWSAVGGSALPIRVIIREATSQTRSSLEAYVFAPDKPTYPANVVTTSSATTASTEMLDALKAFSGAIGMVTLDSTALANKSIALIALDGVAPAPASLATGTWPVRRALYLTTNLDASTTKPAILALIAFIKSPEGVKALSGQ